MTRVDHVYDSTGGMPLETWLAYRIRDHCRRVRDDP